MTHHLTKLRILAVNIAAKVNYVLYIAKKTHIA